MSTTDCSRIGGTLAFDILSKLRSVTRSEEANSVERFCAFTSPTVMLCNINHSCRIKASVDGQVMRIHGLGSKSCFRSLRKDCETALMSVSISGIRIFTSIGRLSSSFISSSKQVGSFHGFVPLGRESDTVTASNELSKLEEKLLLCVEAVAKRCSR